MQTIEALYQEISLMTDSTYDKQKIVDTINLGFKIVEYEDKCRGTEYLFKILTTSAGRIFMLNHRNLSVTIARKAEEFLNQLRDNIEPHKVSLRNTINTFIVDSLVVFQHHNIHIFGENQDEEFLNQLRDNIEPHKVGVRNTINTFIVDSLVGENQDEEEEEYEYLEDDPEEAEEFFDEAEYEEYEYPEEEEEVDEVDEVDEEEQEAQRRLILARQKHEGLLKQAHEEMKRRNDPFFQAAMKVIKEKQKKYFEDCKEEEKRQSAVFRNIIRRELEKDTIINPRVSFKCDYKLAELMTGSKITNKMTQIFGSSVELDYDEELMNVTVYIFDGDVNHHIVVRADMRAMITEIKKEIRKDMAECLYDSGFCKDIAGMISTYVC